MTKKIAVITGTRAEYGILEPIVKKIVADKELELQLYVTGMHLSKEYGDTVKQIEYKIAEKIDMKIKERNEDIDMAISVSEGVKGFANAFKKRKPDLVIVLGDRIEAFAAAVSAHLLNIPIAHIHGGDLTFSIFDEGMRHAITKLAHIHFAATEKSKKRILQMGEEPWRVFNVGAPGIDAILESKITSKQEICKKLRLGPNKKIALVLYHPVTTEWETAGTEMVSILRAMENFDGQVIIIGSNADAGSYKIKDEMNRLKNKKNCHLFNSLGHADFLSLMKNCDVMVGNSSSGIIEAPSLGVSVINVGPRQEGRERAKNVIDVPCDEVHIRKAVEKAINDSKFIETAKKCESPYGNGHASEKIMKTIKGIDLANKKLIQKRFIEIGVDD
ncbi:MAG: UDP-N-acetylglucosamine 2-epimerase [Candidatus Micrarchaeota archaeon]